MDDLLLDELYSMIQQHTLHMELLKDNEMLSDTNLLKGSVVNPTERGIMMIVFILVVVAVK